MRVLITLLFFCSLSAPSVHGFDLAWSRALSGSGPVRVTAMAADAAGNLYVAGTTRAADLPVTADAYQNRMLAVENNSAIFLSKFSPDGELLYSGFIDGSSREQLHALAVDRDGAVYLAGSTHSGDFPLLRQPGVFIAKLNPNLQQSVYITALPMDLEVKTMAVNQQGELVAAGSGGSDLPLVNPLAGISRASQPRDGYVMKLGRDGALLFAANLGASGATVITAVALDEHGIYLAGHTTATNLPVRSPLQKKSGGQMDIFFGKITEPDHRLAFLSYLGGGGVDRANDMVLAGGGRMLIAGMGDEDFPLHNAKHSGGVRRNADAVLAMIDSDGQRLLYSDRIGGGGRDAAITLLRSDNGKIMVAGTTASKNFPRLAPLREADSGGISDGFVLRLSAKYELEFSSPLGGRHSEQLFAIAGDHKRLFVAGSSTSSDFPGLDSKPAGKHVFGFISRLNALSFPGADVEAIFDPSFTTAEEIHLVVANNGGHHATMVNARIRSQQQKLQPLETPGFSCYPFDRDTVCVGNTLGAGDHRLLRFSLPDGSAPVQLSAHAAGREPDSVPGNNDDSIVIGAVTKTTAHPAPPRPAPRPAPETEHGTDTFCYAFP